MRVTYNVCSITRRKGPLQPSPASSKESIINNSFTEKNIIYQPTEVSTRRSQGTPGNGEVTPTVGLINNPLRPEVGEYIYVDPPSHPTQRARGKPNGGPVRDLNPLPTHHVAQDSSHPYLEVLPDDNKPPSNTDDDIVIQENTTYNRNTEGESQDRTLRGHDPYESLVHENIADGNQPNDESQYITLDSHRDEEELVIHENTTYGQHPKSDPVIHETMTAEHSPDDDVIIHENTTYGRHHNMV